MADSATPLLVRRRFTVEEFRKMGEAGLFDRTPRVELVRGDVVLMSPIGRRHSYATSVLMKHFGGYASRTEAVVPHGMISIRLRDDTEYQPDFLLLRPPATTYLHRDPEPADMLLLIEVSDSSLTADRQLKLPDYAAAGILEVWIVNLVDAVVETFRAPEGGTYREHPVARAGAVIAPAALPDAPLAVSDLLG